MAKHDQAMQDFRRQQYTFAAHLRNPDTNPAPEGIEERRLQIYRDLFFNNVKNLLASTFPVLSEILGEERWAILTREFYHHHISHTPLFMEIPQEFLHWMNEEMREPERWPAFMPELAHYEWVELALMTDTTDIDAVDHDPEGNILDGIPVISPVAWPLAYSYPVHRISRDFQPEAPGEQPTFIVVYRKRDDEVGFTEINAVTARLLELMQDNETATGTELLRQVASELGHTDPEVVIRGGADIIRGLAQQDILLGVKPR
ncbi:MAG: putative DNA-binding domain-containing protein [Gammaproteobacteria bacterium]|nr:putative DNA-binding domain-containing protein [Gammaproteobacteria bacterium]